MGDGPAASGAGSSPPDAASLSQRLAALDTLSPAELRAEWCRLYRSPPPRLSRALMVRALAYRIQEKTLGRLAPAMSRKLEAYGKPDTEIRNKRGPATAVPGPGTRLVREWNGRTYTVTVTEQGFVHDGQTYGSLTRVARLITGAHWSGPRFFGLNGRTGSAGKPEDNGEHHA